MFNGRFYGWHTRLYSGMKSFLDLTATPPHTHECNRV